MVRYRINQGVEHIKTKTQMAISTLVLGFSGVGLLAAIPLTAHAATCTPTGFYRDGINMTAAQINPSGTVSGDVDASGCNIAVYYDNGTGNVNHADIHGSNYFGVLVNGDTGNATVNITNSKVHDIGETPLNGTQHGVGIYYRGFGTGMAAGNIWNDQLFNYQKGGIVANGAGTTADIKDNIVTGQGPVNYIAQNGIQVGYGANAQVTNNTVTGNSYTGANNAASGGILVVGGPCYGDAYTTGTQIVKNTLKGNDIGVWLSNVDGDCVSAPATQTNIKVVNNTISNDAVNNTSGYGYPKGYQAGIADQGNNDKLVNNKISGAGYAPQNTGSIYSTQIDADASFTNSAKVHANRFE